MCLKKDEFNDCELNAFVDEELKIIKLRINGIYDFNCYIDEEYVINYSSLNVEKLAVKVFYGNASFIDAVIEAGGLSELMYALIQVILKGYYMEVEYTREFESFVNSTMCEGGNYPEFEGDYLVITSTKEVEEKVLPDAEAGMWVSIRLLENLLKEVLPPSIYANNSTEECIKIYSNMIK